MSDVADERAERSVRGTWYGDCATLALLADVLLGTVIGLDCDYPGRSSCAASLPSVYPNHPTIINETTQVLIRNIFGFSI